LLSAEKERQDPGRIPKMNKPKKGFAGTINANEDRRGKIDATKYLM